MGALVTEFYSRPERMGTLELLSSLGLTTSIGLLAMMCQDLTLGNAPRK